VNPLSGLFSRAKTKSAKKRSSAAATAAVEAHLVSFIQTRRGVEAWIEEPAGINPASILLVAGDGEYTRRSVPSVDWAVRFVRDAGLIAYQAGIVGYPQRMRDWDMRRKNAGHGKETR
jgi:hypothetical protein